MEESPRPLPWVSLVLFAGLVLLCLGIANPAALGAAVALLLVLTVICLIPPKAGEPGGPPRTPDKGHYLITGPSPVRQELTFTGTGRCRISFGFNGNQSMEYRFNVLDASGEDVPEGPWPVKDYPDRATWWRDDHGPAGNIFLRENPAGWSVTVRYALRATDAKAVRQADVKVEVHPPTAKVTIPEQPTTLPEPQTAWGGLDTPSERLTRPANAGARPNAAARSQ